MLYLHLNTWTWDGLGLWLVINISWANFPSLQKKGIKDSWFLDQGYMKYNVQNT